MLCRRTVAFIHSICCGVHPLIPAHPHPRGCVILCRLSHSLRSFCLGTHRRLSRHSLWPGRGATEPAERGLPRRPEGFPGVRAGWDRGTSRDTPTEGGVGASGDPHSGRVTCGNTAGGRSPAGRAGGCGGREGGKSHGQRSLVGCSPWGR